MIAQGNVEIYYNNYILTADQVIYDQSTNKLIGGRQRAAQGPQRQHHRARTASRRSDDFRDAFIQSLSVVTPDDTRIAAEQRHAGAKATPPSTSAPSSRPARTTPACRRCGASAPRASSTTSSAATITYQDAQFELFGVPVVYVPYFEHRRPVGEAPLRLPDAELQPTPRRSAIGRDSLLLRAGAELRLHPPPTVLVATTASCGRATGASGCPNGQYYGQDRGDRPEARRHAWSNERPTAGAASIETKGQFSLSSWWRFGWDVTVESDDSFRRFYQLDPILQTDRVNTVYLQGMSDRNYFSAKPLPLRRPAARPTPPYANSCVASGHRLQLHRRRTGPRRRAELHRACAQHDPLRRSR